MDRVTSRDQLVFIGDVHLEQGDAALEDFCVFLSRLESRAKRIVFLGDLFNLWLGRRELERPHQTAVLERCVALRRAGVRLHYVEGNRDYRIAEAYRGAALDESGDRPQVLGHGGQRWVAVHGDLANAADRQYRSWRRLSRSAPVWWLFNALPGAWRLAVADRLEQRMRASNARFKAAFPEAVVLDYARRLLASGGDAVVLGHFHVERDLTVKLSGRVRRVLVLPEWKGSRRHLRVTDDGDAAFVDS